MVILKLNEWQSVLFAFLASAITVLYFLPRVIKVANHRKITDKPGKHKIHKYEVPTLGGIAIFGGFSIGFLMFVNGHMGSISYFMAAVIILFFIGLKDDLIDVEPYKKIAAQVIAGLILCIFTDLRFTNFHGFLGISEIPLWASVAVTVFLIVIIINSYNLVDGIDGLSSSVGIIASIAFGLWAWFSHDTGFAIMSFSLAGALVVFLGFNISAGRNKIFMGDTGSLIVGFILTVMAIRFNELNTGPLSFRRLESSPSVSIAILIVPLFDALRVIIIRLIRGVSPMKADNRHIHHLMLRAGFSHKRATFYISLANIFIIAVAFLLDHSGILWLGLVILIICTAFTVPVYLMVAKKEHWNWKNYKWLGLVTSEHKDVVGHSESDES